MKKVLDIEGLQKLWTKIKSYVTTSINNITFEGEVKSQEYLSSIFNIEHVEGISDFTATRLYSIDPYYDMVSIKIFVNPGEARQNYYLFNPVSNYKIAAFPPYSETTEGYTSVILLPLPNDDNVISDKISLGAEPYSDLES